MLANLYNRHLSSLPNLLPTRSYCPSHVTATPAAWAASPCFPMLQQVFFFIPNWKCWLVGRSVCPYNILKGREVTLPWSYRRISLNNYAHKQMIISQKIIFIFFYTKRKNCEIDKYTLINQNFSCESSD